jgi:hypothetical protein
MNTRNDITDTEVLTHISGTGSAFHVQEELVR